ncbi:hypothetical protein N7451_002944 [Penicillium sp. IBT 35674x]|nr:hypothetical protein N7451_002944 [Penicillium sp. IBT 35674x]
MGPGSDQWLGIEKVYNLTRPATGPFISFYRGMLIDGQKWACEACIRGHHRPLIRIKRKGRPFATCSVCQATPCISPTDHARQKRETELKHPKVTQTQPQIHMPFRFNNTGLAHLR